LTSCSPYECNAGTGTCYTMCIRGENQCSGDYRCKSDNTCQ
jgi:hypothetical protein